MDSKYFNEIYNDFFNVNKKIEFSDKNNVEEEIIYNIDELYLDDKSKNLFSQILDYIDKYHNKEENNYINFNIIIEGNNRETIDKITNIISSKDSNKHYLDNKNIKFLSLYELNNKIDINDIYNKNGIIILHDLSSFLLLEENLKKMFIYNLKNNLRKKKVTILFGNLEDINLFLSYDNELKNNYFNFRLIESLPTIQDIYNEIINKINVGDKQNVEVLDYITNTYKDIKEYPIYRDNLVNYLSFHKEVPQIKEVKTIDEVFKELNELVGLHDVKYYTI